MANIPALGMNLSQPPYPYNLYRGLLPQYHPMDMEALGFISAMKPHNRLSNIREDLVHLLPKGAYSDKTNDFCVFLDVSLFSPEELTVKIVDDHLIIEGVHEERQAHDVGFVTRNFKRRYELPKGYNPDAIVSKLSSDGILNVVLPKATNDPKVRVINIQQTGPSHFFKNKSVHFDKGDAKTADAKVQIEDVEDPEDQKK